MLNLIRMNIFRMIHSKSMWIILASMMAFAALDVCMSLNEASTYTEQEIQEISNQQSGNRYDVDTTDLNFGITTSLPVSDDGIRISALNNFATDLMSCILLVFITIATSLFFNSETKNGFIKNIAGQVNHRADIFLSKAIVMALYTFVGFVAYFIADFVALSLRTGEVVELYYGDLGKLFACVGIQYVLHVAFACGVGLVATLTRSSSLSITVGLFSSFGMGMMVSVLVNNFMDINIAKFFVVDNVKAIIFNAEYKILYGALAVGIIYTIIYSLAGSIILKKRDVV